MIPILQPDPPNPIHEYDSQIKAKYPSMDGSTAWKTETGWQYYFHGISDSQQAEVLAYARTLGEIP